MLARCTGWWCARRDFPCPLDFLRRSLHGGRRTGRLAAYQKESRPSRRTHDLHAPLRADKQRTDRRHGNFLAADFEDHFGCPVRPDVFFVQLDITVINFDLAGLDILREKGFSLVVEFSQMAQPIIALFAQSTRSTSAAAVCSRLTNALKSVFP